MPSAPGGFERDDGRNNAMSIFNEAPSGEATSTVPRLPGENTQPNARYRAARVILFLIFAALTIQLWRLQIINTGAYRDAAEGNRLRLSNIQPLRGVVYDRNLTPLAVNSPAFVVKVTEADLPSSRRAEVLGETERMLGMASGEIEQTLRVKRGGQPPFTPITIRENVPRDTALALEERSWALPGVQVAVATVREYTDGALFLHLLGYIALPSPDEYAQRYQAQGYGPDERVGASGVEATYESELRGRPGTQLLEVDVGGRPLHEIEESAPEPGRSLVLTIDADLQKTVQDTLAARLAPSTSGVAIIMDPRDGSLLSMVSLPTYDANAFANPDRGDEVTRLLSDQTLPLFDRAIAGQYPPGSTFKLVTGLGALEEGIVNRNTKINCNGGLRIPNPYNPRLSTYLPDWGVLGVLDFVQGLAQSCNVYFYTLGGGYGEIEGLGSERLARYARMMGYGEPSGVDLPSEAAGRVPDSRWKTQQVGETWLPGDTYNMAIGQGYVLATPLQVANVTNGIAMGGTQYRPRVVQAVVDGEGSIERTIDPQILRQAAFKPATLSAVRDGMGAVLDAADVRRYQIPGLKIASKTGTAEFVGPRDAKGNLPTHGWFTVYAPADNPRVSVTVFLEKGGGPGDALPLGMELLRRYFERYPDSPSGCCPAPTTQGTP
jgi:penicillin-binding protein 2